MDPAQHYPTPGHQAKEPREPQYQFRWSIFVGVPVAICVFLFLLNGIEPSFHFEDIMRQLHVFYEDHYVRLACLGVVCITVLLILTSSRKHPR